MSWSNWIYLTVLVFCTGLTLITVVDRRRSLTAAQKRIDHIGSDHKPDWRVAATGASGQGWRVNVESIAHPKPGILYESRDLVCAICLIAKHETREVRVIDQWAKVK